MTAQDVINNLQGNWITKDGRLHFTILNDRIVNTGGTTGIDSRDGFYSVKWEAYPQKWSITCLKFSWYMGFINEMTADSFTVFSFQKPVDVPIYDALTRQFIYTDFVFEFIRR